ncbi:hypothetical protein KAJ83_18945 [Marivibrio halodurans]|uniref:YARHG domain-containing protein n=1 Tax=Marivibrio halodurans TaxID=2039722 RepID=A0A8J7V489_9PROT|nr:hypothetical protein [Marivibrio halodurans]MBP5859106.1 hypothetical protein [Marivibrio halodurans]
MARWRIGPGRHFPVPGLLAAGALLAAPIEAGAAPMEPPGEQPAERPAMGADLYDRCRAWTEAGAFPNGLAAGYCAINFTLPSAHLFKCLDFQERGRYPSSLDFKACVLTFDQNRGRVWPDFPGLTVPTKAEVGTRLEGGA